MRRYLLTLALSSYTLLCSQTEKGNYYIAGASNGNSTIQRTYQFSEGQGLNKSDLITANTSFSLSGGNFVLNNFAVGLITTYQSNRSFRESIFNYYSKDHLSFISRSLSLGTELTYFFRNEMRLRPFLAISGSYSWTASNLALNTPTPVYGRGRGLNLGLNIGLNYFISERWSVYGGVRTRGIWSISMTDLTGEIPTLDEKFGNENFRGVSVSAGFGMMFFF